MVVLHYMQHNHPFQHKIASIIFDHVVLLHLCNNSSINAVYRAKLIGKQLTERSRSPITWCFLSFRQRSVHLVSDKHTNSLSSSAILPDRSQTSGKDITAEGRDGRWSICWLWWRLGLPCSLDLLSRCLIDRIFISFSFQL